MRMHKSQHGGVTKSTREVSHLLIGVGTFVNDHGFLTKIRAEVLDLRISSKIARWLVSADVS